MTQATALVDTLKQELRRQGITYAEVAKGLRMSEANVKRLFASKRFTLERLEEVCGLIQIELSDLFQAYDASRQRINQLTEEQEEELIRDHKLLLVAVSVRNHLGYDDIVNNYAISDAECIHCLAQLDRLKIIDLLPGNRIKLRIADDFRWLLGGPIERFYEKQIQQEFLGSNFRGELQQRLFVFGLLSDSSIEVINAKIRSLAKELAELHRHDANLSLDKRHNIGLMLALRPWELKIFKPFRQKKPV